MLYNGIARAPFLYTKSQTEVNGTGFLNLSVNLEETKSEDMFVSKGFEMNVYSNYFLTLALAQ